MKIKLCATFQDVTRKEGRGETVAHVPLCRDLGESQSHFLQGNVAVSFLTGIFLIYSFMLHHTLNQLKYLQGYDF